MIRVKAVEMILGMVRLVAEESTTRASIPGCSGVTPPPVSGGYLWEAARLDGIPGLVSLPADSSRDALYAVHPYLCGGTTSQYAAECEDVSPLAYLVTGTGWPAEAYDNPSGGIGFEAQPHDMAVQTLNCFARNNIRIVAGAFDVPGTMTQDFTSWTPTDYDNDSTEMSNPDTLDNAGLLSVFDLHRPLFAPPFKRSRKAALRSCGRCIHFDL